MADTIEQAKKIGPTLERHPVPAQPGLPGWACLGTENVQNIHVGLSPGPDYFAEGKSMGMTDAQARAHVAKIEAELEQQMLNTLATLPPPPCP